MKIKYNIAKILSHKLTKNTSLLALLQIFTMFTSAIATIYLTRILGLEIFGVMAFSIGIFQFANVILDVGFSISTIRKISVLRNRKKYVENLIGAIYSIKLVIFLTISIGIMVYAHETIKYAEYSILFILYLLPLSGQALQPIWLFMGLERMGYITILLINTKIIYISLIYLIIKEPVDYIYIPILEGIIQLITAVISIKIMYELGYKIRAPKIKMVKYTLNLTKGYYISRLSGSAYMNGGVLMLGIFSTSNMTAIYSLAEQCFRVMTSAFNPIVQSIYPHIAKDNNLILLSKITFWVAILATLSTIIAYFITPTLIIYIFGIEWIEVNALINIFYFAVVIDILVAMSGYPLSAALHDNKTANKTAISGVLLYFLMAGFLIINKMINLENMIYIIIASQLMVLLQRIYIFKPKIYKIIKR
jgi:PST family polysaccharide transporter